MDNPLDSRCKALMAKLGDLVSFLRSYSRLTECHLVDFITHDLFDTLLPSNLANELLTLSDEELAILPSYKLIDVLSATDRAVSHRSLIDFLRTCREFCVGNVLADPALTEFFSNSADVCRMEKLNVGYCTYEKKSHEVESMASAVATAASVLNTKLVIDIGSGRGYLGSLLAMYYGLSVLGFDASDCNTSSATHRLEKVKKEWKTVLRRAGIEDVGSKSTSSRESSRSGTYQPLTCAVTPSTSLDPFIDMWNEAQNKDPVVVCGLHTCGDLAGNALRMYVGCSRAECLLLVGCCYHLVEERFAKHPFRNDDDPPPEFYGFPLSTVLKKEQFAIGRNTRILASQPVDKMARETILPNRSLFWRALLQQIVRDKLHQNVDIFERRVGRVAKNCKNFKDYVPKALRNLGFNVEISPDEIKRYELEYADYERKLTAFFQLRCALAQPVETIILLDRLCYLLEQESVCDAKIVPLFDPALSPRCHAIWSMKRRGRECTTEDCD